MRQNIFAYTACPPDQTMPEYISVNRIDGELIEITVRGDVKSGSACASIKLTQDQYDQLLKAR